MYRFVKDKRLFMQGTSDGKTSPALGSPIVTHFSNPDEVDNVQAVYTKKRLSTEVLGSSLESTKTSRKNGDGTRRITTRIVRKVTTLTRGEEQSLQEDLPKRAAERISHREESAEIIKAIEPKRVKVRLMFFYLRAL